jgi:hypothetical protein
MPALPVATLSRSNKPSGPHPGHPRSKLAHCASPGDRPQARCLSPQRRPGRRQAQDLRKRREERHLRLRRSARLQRAVPKGSFQYRIRLRARRAQRSRLTRPHCQPGSIRGSVTVMTAAGRAEGETAPTGGGEGLLTRAAAPVPGGGTKKEIADRPALAAACARVTSRHVRKQASMGNYCVRGGT